jgi:uncharacterized protein YndB with AHSA1/START domain
MLHLAALVVALFANQTGQLDKSVVMHSAELPISVEKAWNAFTKPEEMTKWMVARAEIDLRVGGKMLTSYNKDSSLHDDRTIENTYLSYDPYRMISIKATGAPKGFPFLEALKKMWTVIYFEPLGPNRTRVTERSLGFTDDPDSQKMREFFDRGNKSTMDALVAYAAKIALNGESKK